jgi:hypothetical protein
LDTSQYWQRACRLILAKADVMTVSRALELALFMDAALDVSNALGNKSRGGAMERDYLLLKRAAASRKWKDAYFLRQL